MDWLLSRKYQALLVALLLLFVVYPVCQEFAEARLLLDALVAVLFLAAFLTIFNRAEFRVVSLSLGVVALIGLWAGYAIPGLPRLPLLVGFHAAGALFLGCIIAALLGNLFQETRVTANSIYAALCAYLLIGLAFAHLYGIMDALVPSSFHIQEQARPPDGAHAHFQFAYYSLSTLTTLGYGDIIPVKPAARGLAVVEAVLGQFFLAVLIAELIGKRASQGAAPPQGE